jgi:hypothetical protein
LGGATSRRVSPPLARWWLRARASTLRTCTRGGQ